MGIEPSQPLFEGLWLHNEYDGRVFDVIVENGLNRLDVRSGRRTNTIGVHVMTAHAHPACNRDAVKALPEAAWLIYLGAARINSPARRAVRPYSLQTLRRYQVALYAPAR